MALSLLAIVIVSWFSVLISSNTDVVSLGALPELGSFSLRGQGWLVWSPEVSRLLPAAGSGGRRHRTQHAASLPAWRSFCGSPAASRSCRSRSRQGEAAAAGERAEWPGGPRPDHPQRGEPARAMYEMVWTHV